MEPRWEQIYYSSTDRPLMAADVESKGNELHAGTPRQIFAATTVGSIDTATRWANPGARLGRTRGGIGHRDGVELGRGIEIEREALDQFPMDS